MTAPTYTDVIRASHDCTGWQANDFEELTGGLEREEIAPDELEALLELAGIQHRKARTKRMPLRLSTNYLLNT